VAGTQAELGRDGRAKHAWHAIHTRQLKEEKDHVMNGSIGARRTPGNRGSGRDHTGKDRRSWMR
jgi:hypothetical protein